MKPGKTGAERILDATKYSWQGFRAAFKHEAAFRQELSMVLIGLPLAFWFAKDTTQFLFLSVPLLLLLLVELANSAVEAVVDRIGSEYHELSGRAKDMGSATVFIALAIVTLCWVTILGENYLG
jgi:diacylglycerol kinase (ATP)